METKPNLKSRIDHCYALAENGATGMARAALQCYAREFYTHIFRYNERSPSGDQKSVLESLERSSCRVEVNVALQFAEHFYQEGNRSAARQWLYHAKMQARKINCDIGEKVVEIRKGYGDRMPLLFH